MPHAHRLDQRGAGQRRSARAVHHHLDVLELAPSQVTGVDQARGGDDRGAVLVIVHHRDLHPLAQRLLDHEAFGGLDVFQIDAAEARLHHRHRLDDRIGVFAGQFDVDRIDVGEALEQDGLAFHHRLRGQRAKVAKAKDRSAVRNHGNEVALGRILISIGRIGGDRLYRHGHAGRIGQTQIALRRHRLRGDDLDFPRADRLVIEQRLTLGEAHSAVLVPRTRFVGHRYLPGSAPP